MSTSMGSHGREGKMCSRELLASLLAKLRNYVGGQTNVLHKMNPASRSRLSLQFGRACSWNASVERAPQREHILTDAKDRPE